MTNLNQLLEELSALNYRISIGDYDFDEYDELAEYQNNLMRIIECEGDNLGISYDELYEMYLNIAQW